MSWFWIPSAIVFAVSLALLLPVLFERDVKRARFLSYAHKIKRQQHLYPKRAGDQGVIAHWLPYQDQWSDIRIEEIGKHLHAIRQQSAVDPSNRVGAIEQFGAVLEELARSGTIRELKNPQHPPLEELEILSWYISQVDPNWKPQAGLDQEQTVRAWLREHPPSLEATIEILLMAVDMLAARSSGSSDSTQDQP